MSPLIEPIIDDVINTVPTYITGILHFITFTAVKYKKAIRINNPLTSPKDPDLFPKKSWVNEPFSVFSKESLIQKNSHFLLLF